MDISYESSVSIKWFQGAVHTLTFSPDGRYLASSGVDGMVILWDVSNGNIVAQMNGHTESVYTLCFSRCGSVLASGMNKW